MVAHGEVTNPAAGSSNHGDQGGDAVKEGELMSTRSVRRIHSHAHTGHGVGRWAPLAAVAFALSVGAPREAQAQIDFGAQVASAQKTGFGVGPRAVLGLGALDAGFQISADFLLFFPDSQQLQDIIDDAAIAGDVLNGDVDYWEANLNLHVPVGLPFVPLKPYVGGGLNIAKTKIQNSTQGLLDLDRRDTGINILAGAQLNLPVLSPFLEFRYTFGNGTGVTAKGLDGGAQWLVVGGVLF